MSRHMSYETSFPEWDDLDEPTAPVLRCACGAEIAADEDGECDDCWADRIAQQYEAID